MYCIVLYCIVLYCIVLCCILFVLWYIVLYGVFFLFGRGLAERSAGFHAKWHRLGNQALLRPLTHGAALHPRRPRRQRLSRHPPRTTAPAADDVAMQSNGSRRLLKTGRKVSCSLLAVPNHCPTVGTDSRGAIWGKSPNGSDCVVLYEENPRFAP